MALTHAIDLDAPALRVDPTPRHEVRFDLEDAADAYFRAMQANVAASSADSTRLSSGWWVLAAVPLSLSAWVGLGVWILG